MWSKTETSSSSNSMSRTQGRSRSREEVSFSSLLLSPPACPSLPLQPHRGKNQTTSLLCRSPFARPPPPPLLLLTSLSLLFRLSLPFSVLLWNRRPFLFLSFRSASVWLSHSSVSSRSFSLRGRCVLSLSPLPLFLFFHRPFRFDCLFPFSCPLQGGQSLSELIQEYPCFCSLLVFLDSSTSWFESHHPHQQTSLRFFDKRPKTSLLLCWRKEKVYHRHEVSI